MSMDGRGGGGEGGQTRQEEATWKGQQEAKEAEIAVRLKEKMLQKVSKSRTARVTKKMEIKRGKRRDLWRRQSRQSCFTSIWLQLAGVLSDARSPSLSLVREDVFFCLLYSCIYEVVGDLRALGITAFIV